MLFLLPLVNLGLLYLLKYRNQNLSLHNFSFMYTGNVLNFLSTFIFILEAMILFIWRKGTLVKAGGWLRKLLIAQMFFLLAAAVVIYFEIHISNRHILSFPISKIFLWLLFFSGQFMQFMAMSYAWLLLINSTTVLFLRTLLNSVIITLCFYGFVFVYVFGTFPVDEKNEPTGEVGVVFGAAVWSNNVPSTILMERLNKARELYRKRKIEKIQLTGGNAPGELSEAEVAFNYLSKFQINEHDIWIEKKTTSTAEQVKFIKNDLIAKRGIQDIVVISDRFHLKRIYQISNFYNIKVKLCGSGVTLNSKSLVYYKLREGIALINFWFFAI